MSFWVVPRSSLLGHALVLGVGDVEAEEPRRRRVDRHRRVHLADGDAVEQLAHVAEVRHRHADLADLARGRGRGRGRSPSGWGGRRRSRGRSAPWPGWTGTARCWPWRWSARSRCGSSTGDPAAPGAPRRIRPLASGHRRHDPPAPDRRPTNRAAAVSHVTGRPRALVAGAVRALLEPAGGTPTARTSTAPSDARCGGGPLHVEQPARRRRRR